MMLSIIIPTYNEATIIRKTIEFLQHNLENRNFEIIVSDGGSTDQTVEIVESLGVHVVVSPVKGRAGQMNYGVKKANGDVYFFLHADSAPTTSIFDVISFAIDKGNDCGSFRTQFDSSSLLLKFNAFFTRFNYLFFRGGDQGIFVAKKLWDHIGGYKEEMLIMEDYDYIARLWKRGVFTLIPKATIISARKYDENSWLTVQLANLKVVRMYKNGASQMAMIAKYEELLRYRKNAF
jgi:rSAM/selenodomain-associated transferase 2